MTGRHAAPPDESFDQRERDRAGAHRADVEVPLGPDDPVAAAPGRAKKAAARKKPAAASTSKRASKS